MSWYVSIDHLTEEQLSFAGFIKIDENNDFIVYRQYNGDHHIVVKSGTKLIKVDDINDVVAINSARVIRGPDPEDC